jgi:indolepyruvate ferredoxin oxidoreductase alpha subunit
MDLLEKPGKGVVLLGNEAIARGAIEAGMGVSAFYPGTPSSEVPEALGRVAKQCGFYFEYSANEKIAFETVAGAAFCGVRSLTAMKHFGLNVASDSVLPVAYVGVRGGLVVMVADDPQGWSSAQTEQDTRYYAMMARMPMIEPSSPQECLDYTRLAFGLSEEFRIPVFLRTTTKVSHSIGTVKLGRIPKPKTSGSFKKGTENYRNISPALQKLHRAIEEKLARIEKKYGRLLTRTYAGRGSIGVITFGAGFEYCREAFRELHIKPPLLKLGLTHPFPKAQVAKFIRNKKAVLVVEELEPIIEGFVAQVAKDANPRLVVHGKDLLSCVGEYNLETIIPALGHVFGKKPGIDFAAHRRKFDEAMKGLPPRRPVLCPGCPHRSSFYAAKKAFGKNAVYAGDVGCYALGVFEPYNVADFMISMGASLGIGHGIAKVSDQEVVAFIGDSTFFHACLPALANLSYNDGRTPFVIVLDNSVTAMTGHQPHPGTGVTGMGEPVKPLNIADIARSLGATVATASSFNQQQLTETMNRLRQAKGLRVLISKGECRLVTKRKMAVLGQQFPVFEIDQEKCRKCGVCTNLFACPAIVEIRQKKGEVPVYWINPDLCWGCSVCSQICPYRAIHAKEAKK